MHATLLPALVWIAAMSALAQTTQSPAPHSALRTRSPAAEPQNQGPSAPVAAPAAQTRPRTRAPAPQVQPPSAQATSASPQAAPTVVYPAASPAPSALPSANPTTAPSAAPSANPTTAPSAAPSANPTQAQCIATFGVSCFPSCTPMICTENTSNPYCRLGAVDCSVPDSNFASGYCVSDEDWELETYQTCVEPADPNAVVFGWAFSDGDSSIQDKAMCNNNVTSDGTAPEARPDSCIALWQTARGCPCGDAE